MQEYFKAGQAAKYLGISRTTFYQWRKKFLIKSVAVGGVVLFRKKDLDDFVDHQGIENY